MLHYLHGNLRYVHQGHIISASFPMKKEIMPTQLGQDVIKKKVFWLLEK